MSNRHSGRSRVFVSYSHRDKRWLERLQVHLKPLVRDGTIDLWDDTRILAGELWHEEIREALDETRAAILLVTANFMASRFIAEDELPPLLDAAHTEGVVILPLIVSPSLFLDTPKLSRYQTVNPPDEPLLGLKEVEQELVLNELARTIMGLQERDRSESDATASPQAESPQLSTQPSTEQAPPAFRTAGPPSARVDAARQLVATFAPERYTYIGLAGLSGIILATALVKLLLGDGSMDPASVTTVLGSGSAVALLVSRLVSLSNRTMQFIQQAAIGGSV